MSFVEIVSDNVFGNVFSKVSITPLPRFNKWFYIISYTILILHGIFCADVLIKFWIVFLPPGNLVLKFQLPGDVIFEWFNDSNLMKEKKPVDIR